MTFSRLTAICSFLALAQACGAKTNGYLSMGSDAGGAAAGGATWVEIMVGGSSGATPSTGGTTGEPTCTDNTVTGNLPCDVLARACQPCVAAHSTVRVLRTGYTGPLCQVERSGGGLINIMATTDGYADAATQDSFCAGIGCTVKIIYDQSGMGNDLAILPEGLGGAKKTASLPAKADALPMHINGRSAYGLLFRPGMGYRAGCIGCAVSVANGTARGDEPETIYMVTSGTKDWNNGCCFDYGNAETTAHNDGNGTVEAVYLGKGVVWGTGSGEAPWVMADLENGVYAGWEDSTWSNISTNKTVPYDYVTAVLVGDTQDKNNRQGRFALYGGDATQGTLQTMWDGIRPENPGYAPMAKQGSIILSTGGDNSDSDSGRFYEGVMANGAATKATVDALQANIVAAAYGSETIVNAAGGASGTGGASSTGGATSTGTPCTNVTPCGGDLSGTWTVTASCLTVSGSLDMSSAGIDCAGATLSGETLHVTGSVAFDGTGLMYTDNTTTTGSGQISLPAACKNLSGTSTTCDRLGTVAVPNMGYDTTSSCVDNSANGGCSCTGGVNQQGSIGVVSANPGTNDLYATSNNVLMLLNGHATTNYQYCVSGSTLTLTPLTTGIATTGTIVLTKQ
jgi:non-reducing end alpha-L-arabinofuranosidase